MTRALNRQGEKERDSFLRCTVCGREETTNFSGSLRRGWTKCCGYTMRLERTDADIESAVGKALTPETPDA